MLQCERVPGVNAFTLVYMRSHQFHRCERVHTGHFGVNAFTLVYMRSHHFHRCERVHTGHFGVNAFTPV